jgi:hypothetical protein
VLNQPDPARRGAAAFGIVLIALGLFALVGRALSFDVFAVGWPLFVVVPGLVMFVTALGIGGRAGVALAIPGGIVTMTGLVLFTQAATGLWATWAYAWALVAPGGVGMALVFYGGFTRQRDLVAAGLPIVAVGLGLFLAFGLFFEAVVGLNGPAVASLESVLAVGLVVLGLVVLLAGAVRRGPSA